MLMENRKGMSRWKRKTESMEGEDGKEAGGIFMKTAKPRLSAKHPSLIYFVPRNKFDPTGVNSTVQRQTDRRERVSHISPDRAAAA